jgi:hypothetical protein
MSHIRIDTLQGATLCHIAAGGVVAPLPTERVTRWVHGARSLHGTLSRYINCRRIDMARLRVGSVKESHTFGRVDAISYPDTINIIMAN